MSQSKYKIVNIPNGVERAVIKGFGTIDFKKLTEEQKDALYKRKFPHLELIDEPKPEAKKK